MVLYEPVSKLYIYKKKKKKKKKKKRKTQPYIFPIVGLRVFARNRNWETRLDGISFREEVCQFVYLLGTYLSNQHNQYLWFLVMNQF